jgi:hypothetical protein
MHAAALQSPASIHSSKIPYFLRVEIGPCRGSTV